MTSEDTWDSINKYDQGIFPVHYVISLVAAVIVFIIAKKPGKKTDFVVNLFLMLCYFWIGLGFFLIYKNELTMKIQYFQPVLMFAISFLFGIDLFKKKNHYQIPEPGIFKNITYFLIIYSIIGYPLIGWLLKHPYAVAVSGDIHLWVPILGAYPCPTTVFAIALFTASLPKVDITLMILLISWAVLSIVGKPIIEYRAYEDLVLFLAGVYGIWRLIDLRFWKLTGEKFTKTDAD